VAKDPSIHFDEVNARQGAFLRRTFLMGGLTGAGLLALSGRLAQLQLFQASEYKLLAAENQFNYRLVIPPRGRILDRNGVEIASSRAMFSVLINRQEVKDIEAALDVVEQLVPMDHARRKKLLNDIALTPRYVPAVLAQDITWEEFSRVNVRAPELPGITADMGETRVYPYPGAFAHVVGYVGKINDREYAALSPSERSQPVFLHPGFRIGKQGVEKALDVELRGVPGGRKVEVDARGRVVREDTAGDIAPTPGKDVVLTLDADVQNRASEVFGPDSGGAVLMDITNGDILCMTSAPSFDANKFVTGVPGSEYKLLAEYERRPLLDKAMSGVYPPGSTFKMVTALAGLKAGMDPEVRFHCSGGFYFGRRFACHGRHGSVNLKEAIRDSCDVYFYQIAVKVGPDVIAEVAKDLGFGQVFDIGIPGQKKGIVPSTAWKREHFRKASNPDMRKWWPGESPSYGIGQGALTVNALQLATYTARLANGRKALNPRLIKSVGGVERPSGADAPDLPFPAEHLAIVREGMAMVTAQGGTGYRNSQMGLGDDIIMAGKTGTAQVRNYGSGTRKSSIWNQKDHGLFVAYAPIDNPRYAVSVIVQHGEGGGKAAAPKAREIMKVALLKDPDIRRRIEKPLPAPPAPAPGAPVAPLEVGVSRT
jgi:penicillin-binding protein 2